jgi:uncharacterized metal-binding protein YceD (DUF177 family)
VSKRGSYAVRISGLGDGDHDFLFDLDQQFFASFKHPEIESGKVEAKVVFEKKAGVLALHFSMKGQVEVICDRCLEPFMTPIESKQTIYVKWGDTAGEIEDDVLIVGRDAHEIEVGQYLYEFIVLALPYQRIHPADEDGNSACDPEMMKKLEAYKVIETAQGKKTDPRWDALKGIIENNT